MPSLLLLPNELLQCIYQDWVANMHDISMLDIACCNHAVRTEYLSSLHGTSIDFDIGTCPDAIPTDLPSCLLWISSRCVHIAELSLRHDWISTISSMKSCGQLHIKSLSFPNLTNWAQNACIAHIFHDMFSQFVALVEIDFGYCTDLSDEWVQMFEQALADCRTLCRVVLRDAESISDDALLSFLCSHKDTLKDIELLTVRPGVLQGLQACHALETITLCCDNVDRASVLDFCSKQPHVKKLFIDSNMYDGSDYDPCFAQKVLMTCPQLLSLKLEGLDCIMTADTLNDILDRFPKLVYLVVDNIDITIKHNGTKRSCAIEAIKNNIHVNSIIAQLHLPVHGCEIAICRLEDSAIVRLVGDRAESALQRFVYRSYEDTDVDDMMYNDLMYTLQKCSGIQHFEMDCSIFDLDQVMHLLSHLPSVRNLCLTSPAILSSLQWLPLVDAIARLPLHYLHLCNFSWDYFDDEILMDILRLLPSLQVLEISCCDAVKLSTIIAAVTDHLPFGTVLLLDENIMQKLSAASHFNERLKKQLKKGRVQSRYIWRKHHLLYDIT